MWKKKSRWTKNWNEKQVIKMLILVIILFLICWGSRLSMEISIKVGLDNYSREMYALRIVINLLPYIHSCINPFIYSLMSKNFRRSMRRRCQRLSSNCCGGFGGTSGGTPFACCCHCCYVPTDQSSRRCLCHHSPISPSSSPCPQCWLYFLSLIELNGFKSQELIAGEIQY